MQQIINQPLISVCIPTYNGEKYLLEALKSVKNQTYKNIEIIISDDSSSDNTLNIINKFKETIDFPIYIYSHSPIGIGANWNNAIEKSNGEYIKFLFQDDVLKANCIEVMFNYIISNNLEVVLSKRNIIDSNSQAVISGSWYHNYNDLQKKANLEVNDFYIFDLSTINRINFSRFLKNNVFGEPCVSLFSKKIYKQVGSYDIDLNQCLDYVYYLRVLKKYNIGIIGEKLVSFRIHNEQASNVNMNNKLNETIKLYDYHFKLFFSKLNFKNRFIILIYGFNLYFKNFIKGILKRLKILN